jgi:hypothetical protein
MAVFVSKYGYNHDKGIKNALRFTSLHKHIKEDAQRPEHRRDLD